MKNRYTALLGTFLVGYFFVACSVYETSDLPSENIAKKEKKEKVKKAKDKKKPPKEIPTSKAPETPKKPESNTALTEEIKKLSAAIATNAEKVDALDAKFNTQEAQKQNTQQDTPPKNINIEKSNRFLIGYGISDTRVKSDQDSDAREAAYFNARRMLTFSIYKRFSQALQDNHLKSNHLRNILLFTIDKAIDSTEIYKEKKFVFLPFYRKILGLFLVDSNVLERIRQLVRVQYNFTNQQRHVIDRLIYTMQNEDTLH
ncbi:hypothetical protein [Helicobacter suis]|uniref:Lipoprotein n=1 Tax=Helicobacter suis TaxID=104628 RepID=A0A6J4CZE6_9HELI|nr:hypothetical protein [Helicobacter suis]BCD46246.1 hypothetical protein NHP190020_12850 [Helicobacter suis]BCD47840.1 hypothetical protein NHP194003_10440 [Helicobacter suis]BCD49599.1 hypothetical protein NHP194004_10460 [Helicobacter suis]BCD50922.1 hypothetical protein NHP194022_05930 [Helicobacter suis]BCD70585.1 hypothetical protein SNTW_12300 [Helicobacter suis]